MFVVIGMEKDKWWGGGNAAESGTRRFLIVF